MEKSHEIPAWFMQEIDEDAPNLIGATTIAFEREGRYFFDGVIASLLKQGKIPNTIEIALDGSEWSCLARLNYGDGSDDAAFFMPFEIESFALLWNASVEEVHGIDVDRFAMHFKDGATRYPFTASAGVNCELFFHEDRFLAQLDPEFAHELLEEAA